MDSTRPNPNTDLRLQLFLARAGVGARRACEALITAGRVTVNGQVIIRLGTRVNPTTDIVAVDGQPLSIQNKIWLMFNKPRDILCTASDPLQRQTFLDLLPAETDVRVYTVGRLDRDSEGLLLVTNDGALAYKLMHPRYNVEKTYLAWTEKPLSAAAARQLRAGVFAQNERLELDELRQNGNSYRIRLHEGRKRHIRRMFAAVGHKVTRLKRITLGPLQLGSQQSGTWRQLSDKETRDLKFYVEQKSIKEQ